MPKSPIQSLIKLVINLGNCIAGFDFLRTSQELSDELAERLLKSARLVLDRTAEAKARREEKRREACQSYLDDINSTLRSKTEPPNQKKVESNIVTVFIEPPQDVNTNDPKLRKRKAETRRRCEVIRHLPAKMQLAWHASLYPSSWVAGAMSREIFDNLVAILLKDEIVWKPPMQDILGKLRTKYSALQSSELFNRLLEWMMEENESSPCQQPGERLPPPSGERREIKHMFTDSPWQMIHLIPEPFKTIIMNGRQWKWERSQCLPTTGCWASLFPKQYPQDFGLTIWGGHSDGYGLNDLLDMRPAHHEASI